MKKLSIILMSAISLVLGASTASAQGELKTAYIEEVQVTGEASVKDVDCIAFSVMGEIKGLKDKDVALVVTLSYANSLKPVKDLNDNYVDGQGNVMAYTIYTPITNDDRIDEAIFIPDTELHLTEYVHKLRYTIEFIDEDEEITMKPYTGEFCVNGESFYVWEE